MANELIMNVTPGETRIALLERGVLAELSIERETEMQVAGNIYFGRINRVLPGMQAAFVDIGLEKAAFLYVADIVSDMFEGVFEDEVDEVGKNGDAGGDDEEGGDKAPDDAEPTDSGSENGGSDQNANKDRNQGRGGRSSSVRKSRYRRAPLPRIEDVVKEGQTIVVQVAKEPIRTKGARITSQISLPGRYLVYMPTVNHVGVSRRITSYDERIRLKEILRKNKPAQGGFIARTNSIGTCEEKIVEDMNNLKQIWQEIYKKQEKSRAPSLLYQDMDIVLRAVR
ncbi:MAG TPA: ribonuclease E/G, partial [bacterium]|nr:ribonuclease E/G [bacterium]